jgi:uroporphyrinogen-III synthase
LREAGAQPILLPAIAIRPTSDLSRLTAAARKISDYDWLLLTSGNAADAFLPLVDALARKPKLAVVGRATHQRALALGWCADLQPTDFTAAALADALAAIPVSGVHFLMPSGDLAREVLPQNLRGRGAVVDVVEAYRTEMPEETVAQARDLLASEAAPHWVTVASPSAVDNLVAALGRERLAQVKIASIGPATSEAVRARGLVVAAEAQEHTVVGLVKAIRDFVL